jgi:hypothetical protein
MASFLILAVAAGEASSGEAATGPFLFSEVKRLKDNLLPNMDSLVPPGFGTEVKIQLEVFKIDQVDIARGQLKLKVWLRYGWKDHRLSWDPNDYGGVSDIRLFPNIHSGGNGDSPDNRMWVPTLHWYNSVQSPDVTSEVGAAWVTSDGGVYRAVPGHLEIQCRFAGLSNFPRDELSCMFDVGGWDYGDSVMNLTFADFGGHGGALIHQHRTKVDVMESSLTSYQEYSLLRLETARTMHEYTCCPNDPYTNLEFRIFLKRSSLYYFWAIEFPTILITCISFLVFWLDASNCGERLGVGVTMMLAVQVVKIVNNGLLPVCGETLWIEMLLLVNEAFCVVSLVASCVAVWRVFRGLGTVAEKSGDDFDYWMRRTVPATYAVVLGFVYSIELPDGYRGLSDSSTLATPPAPPPPPSPLDPAPPPSSPLAPTYPPPFPPVMSMRDGMFPWIVHVGRVFVAPAIIVAVIAAMQLMKLRRRRASSKLDVKGNVGSSEAPPPASQPIC